MKNLKEIIAGKKILVVEDDQISSEFLKEVLESYNVEIVFVTKGEDAVEKVKNDPGFDLVLMDIRLPGQNGYVTTEAIKSIRTNLPVIAQTAYALEGDREKALNAGCNDYISKPIKAAALLELISKYI
jgi:CheY-like chemotaxis protein